MPKKEVIALAPRTVEHDTLVKLPDYILADAQGGQRGLEDARREDLILPRVSICNSLTPQRKKDDTSYIPGLEEGQLFNTVTGEIYDDGEVQVIPLFFFLSRIYFNPLTEGGGIRCQSLDSITPLPPGLALTCEACTFKDWTDAEVKQERKPKCMEFRNFACLKLPELQPLVVSFKSTGSKMAKLWISIMRMRTGSAYASIYKVTSATLKNSVQTWHGLNVKPLRYLGTEKGDQPIFLQAKEAYDRLSPKKGKIQTDVSDISAENVVEQTTQEM